MPRSYKKRSRSLNDRHHSSRKLRPYKAAVAIPRTTTLLARMPYCTFKLVKTLDIANVAELQQATYFFSRYDYGALGTSSQVIGFNNTSYWPRVKRIF